MSTMKPSRMPLVALAVVALALIHIGCAGPTEVKGQEGNPSDPFSSRMEGGKGTVVEWSHYVQRHRPGKESPFRLVLYNDSRDTWQGRYCIQLLDRHSVVATLTQEEFSLQAGESWSRQVLARFPDDLAEGACGLALIIPGHLSSVTSIEGGKESDTFGGPWSEPVCQ